MEWGRMGCGLSTIKSNSTYIVVFDFQNSPLVYVHGFKATRVDRWRNLQPCAGDCKARVIPRYHIKISNFEVRGGISEKNICVGTLVFHVLWGISFT